MCHLLPMQEYHHFGLPVWRFAVSRNEIPCVYAPRTLGECDTDERKHFRRDNNKIYAWRKTFEEPWATVDFGRWGVDEYALYTPECEGEFHWLCMATATRGGCIEVISPSKLPEECADAIRSIWATTRPLRHLCQRDLCKALKVPWAYLLGIYNYAPCISVFVAESQDMQKSVAIFAEDVEDCYPIALNEALGTEQKNWNDIYRQFEEERPPTREQMKAEEEHRQFWKEFDKKFQIR